MLAWCSSGHSAAQGARSARIPAFVAFLRSRRLRLPAVSFALGRSAMAKGSGASQLPNLGLDRQSPRGARLAGAPLRALVGAAMRARARSFHPLPVGPQPRARSGRQGMAVLSTPAERLNIRSLRDGAKRRLKTGGVLMARSAPRWSKRRLASLAKRRAPKIACDDNVLLGDPLRGSSRSAGRRPLRV